MNPTAFFDALMLARYLTELVQGFSRFEVHLLSYAACLLWLYDGHPYSEWEYDFISSSAGLPYAADIEAALVETESLGLVEQNGNLFMLSTAGQIELELLQSFQSNQLRQRYISGAADALLVLTPGNIREAIEYDPSLSYLKNRGQSEWLLREPDRERLYSNFRELRRLLTSDAPDLLVPLITWLKYLLRIGRNDGVLTSN
jgi:hypothetical protein